MIYMTSVFYFLLITIVYFHIAFVYNFIKKQLQSQDL